MTKRQRAKYYNEQEDEKYLELPMESNRKKSLTQEEQALKRSEVARRRKHQSAQRAEKDKEDTINRLLKKQASKSKRIIKDDQDSNQTNTPVKMTPSNSVRYTSTSAGSQLSLPTSLLDELTNNCMQRVTCVIHGCKNEKKYIAKASGKAVCSLEHYKLAERT
ncbi:PAPA-1-like conserved region-domain-containing protein [Zychaea mexicana]|uniref:PAPA-1-like conserved region-domain-containing protein n=1 Tax=Zychaea mexicana TaxID=64656 RepID=UPI0022FDD148|nr:PAPA-1-like conserved region-domain-containing protein [Zychaea mexicana]KAI9490858.1 PAPA-1-like conserved region-domain-containing protein [Zychaea mexicana]